MAHSRLLRRACAVSLPLVASGCVDRNITADGVYTKYSLPFAIAMTLVCIAAPILGWRLLHRPGRRIRIFACLLLVSGPLFLITMVPVAYLERVFVGTNSFEARGIGIWWTVPHYRLRYEDITDVEWKKEMRSAGRSGQKKAYYILRCRDRSGNTALMPYNELLQAAYSDLMKQFRAHNLKVWGEYPDAAEKPQ